MEPDQGKDLKKKFSILRRKMIYPVLLGAAIYPLVIIALVVVKYISKFGSELSSNQEVWGQFGDYFGGVLNPILSFFAFAALLYTVHLQIESGNESEDRHSEQVFDSRLFQLLNVNFEILKSLVVYQSESAAQNSGPYEGYRGLHFVWHRLCDDHLMTTQRGDHPGSEREAVFRHVNSIRRLYRPAISSYFNSVFFVLDYVQEYSGGDKQTVFALKALRSQMSVGGRALLFYFMIVDENYCKLIPVLRFAGFWDDVVDDPLRDIHDNLYKASAVFHQK
ncbi:hypothetical protein PALA42_03963 [Pseudomonas aeruginosa]|nr:hypothetical protein PALA42_03963 [Pseudomonas aeruginosa]